MIRAGFRYRAALLAMAAAFCLPVGKLHAQTSLPSLLDQPPPAANSDDIRRFCSNITEAARERRYAVQKAELEKLRGEIEDKIMLLEQKRSELEEWAQKREAFSEAANEGLVEVYAKMRPDAAAQRMEKLPSELTAALLTKLKPRAAGTILNEMSAEQAAMVTVIMAAAADKTDGVN
ncbi:MotE family protein [Oricola sp.]|uniref:MotE family protein n=1 Tax=Oricola sp. TaxID=1979950 RepID=UPI003BA98087